MFYLRRWPDVQGSFADLVVAPENPFVVPALEEVAELKAAVVAVAMVAVVPTEGPAI
jgi:hypothetical protein